MVRAPRTLLLRDSLCWQLSSSTRSQPLSLPPPSNNGPCHFPLSNPLLGHCAVRRKSKPLHWAWSTPCLSLEHPFNATICSVHSSQTGLLLVLSCLGVLAGAAPHLGCFTSVLLTGSFTQLTPSYPSGFSLNVPSCDLFSWPIFPTCTYSFLQSTCQHFVVFIFGFSLSSPLEHDSKRAESVSVYSIIVVYPAPSKVLVHRGCSVHINPWIPTIPYHDPELFYLKCIKCSTLSLFPTLFQPGIVPCFPDFCLFSSQGPSALWLLSCLRSHPSSPAQCPHVWSNCCAFWVQNLTPHQAPLCLQPGLSVLPWNVQTKATNIYSLRPHLGLHSFRRSLKNTYRKEKRQTEHQQLQPCCYHFTVFPSTFLFIKKASEVACKLKCLLRSWDEAKFTILHPDFFQLHQNTKVPSHVITMSPQIPILITG